MAFTFGQKLTAVRKGRDLSKADLASRCKFARSTINRYENDKMDVSAANASMRPSGLNEMAETSPDCGAKAASSRPLAVSQSLTLPS